MTKSMAQYQLILIAVVCLWLSWHYFLCHYLGREGDVGCGGGPLEPQGRAGAVIGHGEALSVGTAHLAVPQIKCLVLA